MDHFAAAVAAAAGWPAGSLAAVYKETLEDGVARIGEPDAVLALVTLPFFLQNEGKLKLVPKLQAVPEGGPTEIWSLVVRKGAVASPAALEGWEIVGIPAYAPDYVRGPVLGKWGVLPVGVKITYSRTVLSSLRRAAAGEKVAVLLDAAGVEGISKLPFAADLEVVASSEPLPVSLVCVVADRLQGDGLKKLVSTLKRLHENSQGALALRDMQMMRFDPVDLTLIAKLRASVKGKR
jgi:hypothetical protein